MTTAETTHDQVRAYYGKALTNSRDLKTDACCISDAIPLPIRQLLKEIDDEILAKFYGCGSPIPPALEGCTVLDMGCGTGRDSFLCSKLVGEQGRVIGVDMTDEQLEVAIRLADTQAQRFGFAQSNVTFKLGLMEDLASLGIETNSVDVVISNCVINLAPDKEKVFSEIFRVLKPGGELYFSDVFTDRRLPVALVDDPVLLGECLAGAMYFEDFRRMIRRLGIEDVRVMTQRPLAINHEELAEKVGAAKFYSKTIRAFNLTDLDDRCEDYGQVAIYRGTIPFTPHRFQLDDHHVFETGRPHPVCGNTASMLEQTRLGKHFEIMGNRDTHFGLFSCDPSVAANDDQSSGTGCC